MCYKNDGNLFFFVVKSNKSRRRYFVVRVCKNFVTVLFFIQLCTYGDYRQFGVGFGNENLYRGKLSQGEKKVCRSSVDESKRKFSCGDKNDRT